VLQFVSRFLISAFVALVLAAATGGSAMAQSSSEADPLAKAIEQAADSGVGVIIVDSRGQLVGAGDTPSDANVVPGTDKMEGASALMKAQSEVDQFGEALRSRLEAMPYSIFEVQYILRQTSPDGRIITYVKVLGWSLLFLFIGRWLSVEIYGKRIAKRHVVARIKEAPEGYEDKMPFLVFRFLGGRFNPMIFRLKTT